MFGLSYCWHGLFLNDYQLITYPLGIYLTAAAIVYLLIGFLMGRAFTMKLFDKISQHPLLRGPAVGFACGILVYLVATVVHVNFTKDLDLKYMLLDITWQGIEQGIGGLLVGIVYMTVFEPFPHPEMEEDASAE